MSKILLQTSPSVSSRSRGGRQPGKGHQLKRPMPLSLTGILLGCTEGYEALRTSQTSQIRSSHCQSKSLSPSHPGKSKRWKSINQSISSYPSVPMRAQWGVRSNIHASRQQERCMAHNITYPQSMVNSHYYQSSRLCPRCQSSL